MTSPRSGGATSRSDEIALTVAANRRRAALLVTTVVAAITLVVTAAGLGLGHGLAGLLAGALIASGLTTKALAGIESTVVTVTRARPADPHAHARLLNVVDGLCLGAGLVRPSVHVVDDAGVNALTVGLAPGRTALCVTSGLLAGLTRIELEGVIARQVGLVRSGDAALAGAVVALVGRPMCALARLAPRRGPTIVVALLRRVLGAGREPEADFAGVGLTRYPPGLTAALEKVAAGARVASAPIWSHPLWLANPSSRTSAAGALPSGPPPLDYHPPIEERIQALKEL